MKNSLAPFYSELEKKGELKKDDNEAPVTPRKELTSRFGDPPVVNPKATKGFPFHPENPPIRSPCSGAPQGARSPQINRQRASSTRRMTSKWRRSRRSLKEKNSEFRGVSKIAGSYQCWRSTSVTSKSPLPWDLFETSCLGSQLTRQPKKRWRRS